MCIQLYRPFEGTYLMMIHYYFCLNIYSGTTDLKEQIAFFYRIKTVAIEDSYTYQDKNGAFERPPFIGLFKSKENERFKFVYAAVHLKPEKAIEEMNNLPRIYSAAVNKFKPHISAAFIMGDMK